MEDERPINIEEFQKLVIQLASRLMGKAAIARKDAPLIFQCAMEHGEPGMVFQVRFGYADDLPLG